MIPAVCVALFLGFIALVVHLVSRKREVTLAVHEELMRRNQPALSAEGEGVE